MLFSKLAVAADLPYFNKSLSPELRAQDLLGRLTVDEKIGMLSGDATGFATKGIERLRLPSIKMADGPLGIRIGRNTAFPSGILLGATFNPELVAQVSANIALEAKARGRNMLLGPCIDISRNPFGGRNFESFGEDPFLTSRMAESYVKSVQNQGVLASTKHFALNDQEFKRMEINVLADERTMQEIHFPAFHAAVNAGTATIMASYNKLNGFYASENSYLLTQVLKSWGFNGWVVSDWGATHSLQNAFNAGLDVEMPHSQFFNREAMVKALAENQISNAMLDNKVYRILLSIFKSGVFDADVTKYPPLSTVGSSEHLAVAKKAAQEGLVLLKNRSEVLPLKLNQLHSLALLGPGALNLSIGGGGSSMVAPTSTISPVAALQTKLGRNFKLNFIANPTPLSPQQNEQTSETLAAESDVAVIFVGAFDSEGHDRSNISLPADQNQLISSVAKANPRTVVVITGGNPVAMPWLNEVAAVVYAWYPGQLGSEAIADLLLGNINPSGKLPISFPKSWQEHPAFGHYPEDPGLPGQVTYSEGIYVGYRFYDTKKMAPLFPFGFGLSYTHFSYSDIKLSLADSSSSTAKVAVTFTLKNSGKIAGAEVAELYIQPINPRIDRPLQELKGFKKIQLAAGESKQVTLNLDSSSFAYYSTAKKQWQTDPGLYEIVLGGSSCDRALVTKLELK